ncbi:glycoside hydrolase family 2 TIM barrel-domain containing protein [Microbacterium sp. 179-I 3D2 NHS]|uniref:glycoside hydrolase family 2 TIM barrel-domain containing protein n=1 Tax=Microbacterium sp. 179-I 3D2 NHS TaxID=3235178 RepID=UPI00399F289C
MPSPRALLIAVTAAASLLLPSLVPPAAAAALDGPGAVGPGAVYAEDFASIDDWTPVSGSADEWSAAAGILSGDTRGATSGSYLRPGGALTLPAAYELRTHMKIDAVASDGTVSLLLDMRDTSALKASGISAQFTAFAAKDRAGVRLSKPIASTVLCSGSTPIVAGQWVALTVRRANDVTAVYVDDQLVAAAASPAAGGTIGLGTYRAAASFGPISVDVLGSAPADHPAANAGCGWKESDTPPQGPGGITGSGVWVPSVAAASDRPGHEVTAGESTMSLDGAWSFSTDPDKKGEEKGWHQGTGAAAWEKRTVPDNWDLSDRYGTYVGAAWYQRTFQIGAVNPSANERVRIAFGAVYENTDVWINGKPAGNHRGGYTPFEFDVTDLLVSGENTVVVRADNTFQQGAWWSWGGISRSVELIKSDTVGIDRQQIVATPDLAAETAKVTSTVFVENAGPSAQSVALRGTVTDASTGAVLVDGLTARLEIPAGKTASTDLVANLAAGTFRLWNLDDPAMYRFDVSLDAAAGHTDSAVSDRFGIRLFEIDGIKVTLNGEQLRLAGANRVSDDPVHGNTEPLDLVRRDMDRMKASGLDLARIMHYAQTPELLDYADEIGMLLIDEVPVWQNGRSLAIKDIDPIKTEFRVMVERDFNHPSIFAHSVANEIESHFPVGKEYDRVMAEYSKEIDPTRFVTQATNTMNWVVEKRKPDDDPSKVRQADEDGSQFMDFVSINTYDREYFAFNATKPLNFWGKPVFVSEYSPDGYTFGVNRETLDFSTQSAATAKAFADLPHVFGWSQWTYNDYRSDFQGTGPNLVRGWGNQDVWGRLKAGYAATQAANAPISSLTIDAATADATTGVGLVTLTPRPATNPGGPLRTLTDHRLVVRTAAADGTVVGGTVVDLPTIEPGSAAKKLPLSWSASAAATRVTVSLLSPAGYEVAVAVRDVVPPAAPVIGQTVAADGALRIRFDDPADIGRYSVTATDADGTIAATVTTAESFADLSGLQNGRTYTVRVAAVGTEGAGPAAEIALAPAAGGALPPKVVALTPAPGALVLGYSDDTKNGTYDVEVYEHGTQTRVQAYSTSNRPGTRIEGLDAGTAYDVRLREAASTPSTWSERFTAVPLAADSTPALQVRGTVAGARSGGIVVAPSEGTERYRVRITGPSTDRSYDIERAAVEVLPIDDLAPSRTYQVSVAAVGAAGASASWSGTISTPAAASDTTPGTPTGVAATNRGNDAFLRWDGQGGIGYLVERVECGSTTQRLVTGTEASLGLIGAQPGTYRVRALGAGLSDWSAAVTVPGVSACPFVITPTDTAPRDDGSVPFRSTGTWPKSSLQGPGSHPSVYADLSAQPKATATWTAPTLVGTYRLRVSIPSSSDAAKGARYTVTGAQGSRTVAVDQVAQRGTWVDLGEVLVDADHPATVQLAATGSGFLRASAVEFTPVPDPSMFPVAPQPTVADQSIDEEGEIAGGGSAPGDVIEVSLSDGTSVGKTEVGADGLWSVDSALPAGEWTVTVLERDDDGWVGTATATVVVRAATSDGATAAPARGVLSSTSGVATGLHDGTFDLTMNLWWGENASTFRLYENGELIATKALAPGSPQAQSATVPIAGRGNGTYVYTGVLANSKGETEVAPVTVTVKHARPGAPVLSDDNWDGDGTFTLTADLWWGTNASSYRFLEDGVVVGSGDLAPATPQHQRAQLLLEGRSAGAHTYTVEFVNAAGSTLSAPRTVVVR